MSTSIRVIQGGQAAGKNYAIAQDFIRLALHEKEIFTVMSDTYDNLRDGSIADFKTILEMEGYDWKQIYNGGAKEITLGDSVIQFRYISDIKSDAGKSKRRGYLYINEGNKIGWEVAATYIGRTRHIVYIDHNPDFEYWAHTEVPKLKEEDGSDMSSMLIVTYRDNEECPAAERRYIEARKDNTKWYNVYGLGQTGTYSDRQIYKFDEVDAIPDEAIRINSGMDFGYSPDPTILVDFYIHGADLYADERFCENGLMPEKIPGAERLSVVDIMDRIGFEKDQLIIGDTSGRDTIYDMMKYGYSISAVRKNIPQIDGINKVLSYNLYITKRSTNVISGCKKWFRKIDKNGRIVPEPEGHEPDGLAAMRYAIMFHTA